MHYYGTRLSENISRRPEGYLLCLNVPVARSGTQEYLPEELGLPAPATGPPVISVYRPEEEVFAPETIASFEGMPVTNDHPPDGINLENIRSLQKGHAQNVRRGTGNDADLLLADLMITDARLIHLILNEGKREISCGYTYELCQEEDRFIQRKIRGNHIAVVDAGRAGPRVSIKDEEPSKSAIWVTAPMLQPSAIDKREARSQSSERRSQEEPNKNEISNRFSQPRLKRISFANPITSERRKQPMIKSLYRKLLRMARDGDPEAIEAIAEMAEALIDPETPEVNVTVVNEEPAAQAAPATQVVPAAMPVAEGAPAAQPVPVICPAAIAMPAVAAPATPAPAAAAPAVPDPAVAVETQEGNEVVVDGDTLSEILYRLDRLIDLLSPGAQPLPVSAPPVPADCNTAANRDEQPEEEVAEAVEEVMEAINASTEAVESAPSETVEAISALVEEVLEPAPGDLESILSSVLEPTVEGEEKEEDPNGISEDALRSALMTIRPKLKKMSPKARRKAVTDLAAKLKRLQKPGADNIFAALAASGRSSAPAPTADLGKQIMAARNINYKQ